MLTETFAQVKPQQHKSRMNSRNKPTAQGMPALIAFFFFIFIYSIFHTNQGSSRLAQRNIDQVSPQKTVHNICWEGKTAIITPEGSS